MSEKIKMLLSIDCWSCGTFMTLDERSENDGDCPRCSAEIDLELYLAKVFAGYAVRDARITELELLAAAISADCNDMANERNQFRAELAALKFELEVAKTDELSAAVWAATEMIKHELWDAQAEIVKCDARIAELEAENKKYVTLGKLAAGCGWAARLDEVSDERDQLRAELAANKAQEPAGYFQMVSMCNKNMPEIVESNIAFRNDPGVFPLYAAPVAKQVVMQSTNFTASNGEQRNPRYQGQFEGETHDQAAYRLHWVTAAIESERLNAADQEGGV